MKKKDELNNNIYATFYHSYKEEKGWATSTDIKTKKMIL